MVQFKYKNRKSQVTPEIMFGVGTIMFLFLLIAVFTLNYQIKLGEQEDYIEKRSECLKMTNLINSVYVSGPGTEVQTHTDFLITAFNGSMVSVESLSSVEEYGDVPRIAFLASESGPTTRAFYDQVNEELDPNPDWYKNCFSGIGSTSSCDWVVDGENTAWMNTQINRTIHDLMNNLDNYNTIYLEDPTFNYDYFATDYLDRLSEWVAKGNALILSEHVFCSEGWGSYYSNTSYLCADGNGDDNWEMLNVRINQRFDGWGFDSTTNVIVNDTDESFDLTIGDQLSFEERPYLLNINATNFKTIAKYVTTQCGTRWNRYPCLRDSSGQTAIAYWDYGDGKIFYFGDFYVNYINIQGKQFSEVIIDLISIAYYLVANPESNSDITCQFSAFAPYKQVFGDIRIRNENNYIILENVNQTE